MSLISTASPSALSLLVYRRVSAPCGFLVLLSLVLTALWLLRAFFHDGPSNADVHEQLSFLGTWRFGYGGGANPPFFTWLVKMMLPVMPDPHLAVEFVRFAMLWLFCVFLWLSVRTVTGEEDLGVMAGLAPFAVYMVGWESLFRYSNTMALIMSVGLGFFALVRLDRRGETGDYLLFGLATAIGILSKYNYMVFWIALIAAALVDPVLRARILHRRFLLALGVTLMLVIPLAWWLAGHVDTAMSHGRMRAYGTVDNSGWLIPREALVDLAGATLGLVFPLLAVIAALVPRSLAPLPAAAAGEALRRRIRFLSIHLAVLGLLILASMAMLSVTDFPKRYLYVGLLIVPWLILRVAAARPDLRQRARLVTALTLLAIVTVFGTALRYAAYPYYGAHRASPSLQQKDEAALLPSPVMAGTAAYRSISSPGVMTMTLLGASPSAAWNSSGVPFKAGKVP